MFKQVTSTIGFPLLAKELSEQAARPRTYLLRVIYAVLFFATAVVMFSQVLERQSGNPLAALGQGRRMFQQLIQIQTIGLWLFVPAMTAGAITQEKERNSLGSLFLTRLGPWTILFEKLLGRLVPVYTFLLLALPLLAYTYTLGGVTGVELWGNVWMLFLSTLLLGSVSLLCSAFCRTTVGAFISAYPACYAVLALTIGLSVAVAPDSNASGINLAMVITFTIVGGLATATAIGIARVVLVERAFVEPRNFLLIVFRGLDKFFHELNQITGGIVLVRDANRLPSEKPITWRETQRKSLGTAAYLFRILTAIEIPLVFVLVLVPADTRGAREVATVLLYLVWVIALVFIAVKATSVVSSERTTQTLSVLLTAPMTGAEVLKQKFDGVKRLVWVLMVPFFTIFGFVLIWEGGTNVFGSADSVRYLAGAVLSVIVFLPLVAWGAFYIGLVVKSQARAILVTMATLFAVMLIPVLLRPTPSSPRLLRSETWRMIVEFSPSGFVLANESRQLEWPPMLGAAIVYGLITIMIRVWCLKRGDRLLERAAIGESEPRELRVEG